jgi:hypothetical protein
LGQTCRPGARVVAKRAIDVYQTLAVGWDCRLNGRITVCRHGHDQSVADVASQSLRCRTIERWTDGVLGLGYHAERSRSDDLDLGLSEEEAANG